METVPSTNVHQRIVEFAAAGEPFAVAIVLATRGSTPCKTGAQAIFDAAGTVLGTIGGGVVEAEVQLRAPDVIASGQPLVLDFDLNHQSEMGRSVCGGSMRVLLDPTAAQRRNMYAAAADVARARRRGALVTQLRQTDHWQIACELLVADDVRRWQQGHWAAYAQDAVREACPLHVPATPDGRGQSVELLVEPILPAVTLLLVGGGHVNQAVAAQARLVGFEVVVMDDRPEFTRAELFPGETRTICAPTAAAVADFPHDQYTYIVIATRGHQHDADALAACIRAPVPFIGMIGSRRKVAWAREWLVESRAATEAEFARVYAPVGLEIGAVTVPEIAASIVAQLVAVRRLGAAPRMSGK